MRPCFKIILRIVELLVVVAAVAVLFVRTTASDAFRSYRETGGTKSFWTWFAKERLGLAPMDEEDGANPADKPPRDKRAAAKSERNRAAARAATNGVALARREAQLLAQIRRIEAQLGKTPEKSAGASGKRKSRAGKPRKGTGSGGAIKVGGKSSYQKSNGLAGYRVQGIRGIEFGSSDNAPAAGMKPTMQVSYDADGNMVFRSLRWEEKRELSESIYGFNRAELHHTFDTEQLASVTFSKSFPKTEDGMREALAFYSQMSGDAAADLGFEIIDVDRTGATKSATLYEFRNGDGETSIRGAISSWSQKSVVVTLSVSDKAMTKEQRVQSDAAYASGVADTIDARIEKPHDMTDVKAASVQILNGATDR